MATIFPQNPGTAEIQSPLIAGITEALNKISSILSLETKVVENAPLKAIAIDNSEDNKNRIYEDYGNSRLWLSSPTPVIKKNGVAIDPQTDNFTIDYLGGSITFSASNKPSDDDVLTFSATCISNTSETIKNISSTLNLTKTQAEKYKGNFDNLSELQSQYPTSQNGDYAIVFDPLAVFAWKNGSWQDTRSIEDLSNYYTKPETDGLLESKEPTINKYSDPETADKYYFSGNKTWKNVEQAAIYSKLTGISYTSSEDVTENDTILSAAGKLQARTSESLSKSYITGTSEPTTDIVGSVGQRYVDTSTGKTYICTHVSDGVYTWEPIGVFSVNGEDGDVSITASSINAIPASEKNVANGVATLDSNIKLNPSQANSYILSKSSSFALSNSESGKFIYMNNSADATITLTSDSEIGTELEVFRYTDFNVYFTPSEGTNLYSTIDSSVTNATRSIANKYGVACLKKIDATGWLITGELE